MANCERGKESAEINFISECFVKPRNGVKPSNQRHYLGPNELYMLSLHYMHRAMIFTSSSFCIHIFLEKLKDSLSVCLDHFYPLAGQLATEKFPDDHASFIFVDSTKGPGARVLHATLHLHVSDLLHPSSCGHDVSPVVPSLCDLGEIKINHDGHVHPLLSIQVTELLDGVVLGFSMNHTVADGTSLWHFISSLSHIFLHHTDTLLKEPIFKPFIPDGYNDDPNLIKLSYIDPEEFVEARFEPGPLRGKILHFSPTSLAKLKAKANQEYCTQQVSSFQALCPLLWRSITQARSSDPEEVTDFLVVVNDRPRLDPPLSSDRFGSYVTSATSSCTVGELLGHDLGWAAKMVHESLEAHNDRSIRGFLEMCVKESFVAQPVNLPTRMVVGGSTKFDMYEPEFKLGRAVGVLSGDANSHDGKVVANPGRETGSVDLQMWLRPQTMAALELDAEFMNYVS